MNSLLPESMSCASRAGRHARSTSSMAPPQFSVPQTLRFQMYLGPLKYSNIGCTSGCGFVMDGTLTRTGSSADCVPPEGKQPDRDLDSDGGRRPETHVVPRLHQDREHHLRHGT